MDPPSQLRMDALNTATPNLADGPPLQSSTDALNTATSNSGRWTPQSIKHRCLEYHYTKLGRWPPSQLNINALNTTTLNWADGSPTTPLPSCGEECTILHVFLLLEFILADQLADIYFILGLQVTLLIMIQLGSIF